jgi:hypothetical protein
MVSEAIYLVESELQGGDNRRFWGDWLVGGFAMPIDYAIDSASPFVHAICTGEVTDADLLGHSKQIASELPESVPELFDLSEVKRYRVTAAGMRRVAIFDAAYAVVAGASPVAIVAARDFTYGMSRMYQIFSESNPNPIEIFRCTRDAKEWLLAEIAENSKRAEQKRRPAERSQPQPAPLLPRSARSRLKAALFRKKRVKTCGKFPKASPQGPVSAA